MFRGEYEHTIDAKGRIIIPAKLRDALGEQFIVTKGLDGCLFVYPMEQWAIFEEKLQALPLNQPSARSFARFFFSGATECELDIRMLIKYYHASACWFLFIFALQMMKRKYIDALYTDCQTDYILSFVTFSCSG